MKKSVLRAYARLIARTGVNIQKGQEVFIAADLDQPEFVAMLVDECYKCKAKKVVVDWNYQPLQKLHVRHRSLTTLSRVEDYELARWQHYVDTIPCRIYLLSEDPDGLKGIDQEKLAKSQQAKFPVILDLLGIVALLSLIAVELLLTVGGDAAVCRYTHFAVLRFTEGLRCLGCRDHPHPAFQSCRRCFHVSFVLSLHFVIQKCKPYRAVRCDGDMRNRPVKAAPVHFRQAVRIFVSTNGVRATVVSCGCPL